MRDWIKESDKAYHNVRYGKLEYWRKPTRSSYFNKNQMAQIENDGVLKTDVYLSHLNSLLEKHKIEFKNEWTREVKVGDDILLYR